jgi:Mg2+ and Co2+ transporter CorA
MARPKAQQVEQGQEAVTVQRFMAASVEDFAKHGLDVIEQMREKTPAAYAMLAIQAMQAQANGQQIAEARDFMMIAASLGPR